MNTSRAADKIADLIVRQLITEQWPEGTLIGTEASLIERFGVGRATLREVIRELELHGIVRMTRGAGLIVSAPVRTHAIGAMTTYLLLLGPTPFAIGEARQLIASHLAELAALRIDEAGIAALRDSSSMSSRIPMGERLQRSQEIVLQAAANPILAIFWNVIETLASVWDRRQDAEVFANLRFTQDAIASGDGAAARYEAKRLYDPVSLDHKPAREAPDGVKRGAEIAWRIARDNTVEFRKPGELLATETQLIARYGVSRAIMREGLSILASHGFVVRRRGVGGGVIMGKPNSSYTVAMSKTMLRSLQVAPDDLVDAQQVLQPHAAFRAAQRRTPKQLDAMIAILLAPGMIDAGDDREFHNFVADASDQPIIALFIRVLLATFYRMDPAELSSEFLLKSRASNTRLLVAIADGDQICAHHHMLRHIEWERTELRTGNITL